MTECASRANPHRVTDDPSGMEALGLQGLDQIVPVVERGVACGLTPARDGHDAADSMAALVGREQREVALEGRCDRSPKRTSAAHSVEQENLRALRALRGPAFDEKLHVASCLPWNSMASP